MPITYFPPLFWLCSRNVVAAFFAIRHTAAAIVVRGYFCEYSPATCARSGASATAIQGRLGPCAIALTAYHFGHRRLSSPADGTAAARSAGMVHAKKVVAGSQIDYHLQPSSRCASRPWPQRQQDRRRRSLATLARERCEMHGDSAPNVKCVSSSRVWWTSILLLLASAINYMDRQTLANTSVRVTREFGMSEQQYGNLEAGFGWAFAGGSLFFGFLADRVSLRWLYAGVLLCWSAIGFATGFVTTYEQLLACRTLLGFFEAGHWPCGIKTVRAILSTDGRAMGNGVLQSGTSLGAIATPLIVSGLLTAESGSWRLPFLAIGAVGVLWAAAWVALAPREALAMPRASADEDPGNWWRVLVDRRLVVIFAVVALINTTWQLLRAWLPKFLQQGHGYAETHALYYNSLWFAATDVGCLGAGALVLWLARRGHSARRARLLTFFACSLMCLGALALPWLEAGWLLLGALLVIGAGALGVFPIYHAFTQDLSHRHQGKITGIAGVAAWAFSPLAQRMFGKYVDQTHSFDRGLALAGCLPMIACLLLAIAWPKAENERND